ncbi:SpoIIE family protein phosphatase [Streptomyces antimycoticus]|uniref:ATP-binding SpoIIE family protein phosphatase n=1 Tax=Streptomyces antimycoticus TaxID=68175 RepID=UPI0037CD5A5C
MVDAGGCVRAWSSGATDALGYSAAEAVGRHVGDVLAVEPPWPAEPQEWRGEATVRHRDGHDLTLWVSVHRLAGGGSGEPLWLLIADPEPAPPAAGAEALSGWLLTSSPIALSVYDTEMRCVRQNDAMRRLTGVADQDRVGRGLTAVLEGPDTAMWESRMHRVLATGRAVEDFVVRGRTRGDPDHDHVFSASASPLRDGQGQLVGLCATVLDITEERRGRERLALLSEATTRIGSTLDVMRTGQELAEVVVPRLADFVSVDLLEALISGDEPAPGPVRGAVLRRVAHQSVREGVPEAVTSIGDVDFYTAHSPQARCLATGRSELHRVVDLDISSWVIEDPVRRAKLEKYGFHSWVIVPVTARGTTLGVVVLVRAQGSEPFEAEDVAQAEELVARAAVCLDNARRFTRERTAALALQRSLLPRRLPAQSAVEAAFRYLPAEPRLGVGGDWFDVIPLSGGRVALVVGDVVGHGIQACATMGRLRTAVRTLADVDLAPDELLTQLDDIVIRVAAAEADAAASSEVGATCVYAVYDPVSGRCCLASAGHPAPAMVFPGRGASFLDVPAGPPLGVGGLPFEAVEAELPEGILLAFYTDGLLQIRQLGVEAGLETLRRALSVPTTSLEALCEATVRSVLQGRPVDDVALLLARVRRLDARQVASWTVPDDPQAVAGVRADAVRWLSASGLDEAAFVTELVVSEMVTNAIRYGGAPIGLRLIRDRTLICEVSDASSTAPHLRRARVFDEGGRGLLLVAQLTQRWGTRQTANGKIIWCEQALPSAA